MIHKTRTLAGLILLCLLLAACGKAESKESQEATKAAQAQSVLLTAQSNVNAILTQTAAAKKPTTAPLKPTNTQAAAAVIPTLAAPTQKPAVVNNNTGTDSAAMASETVPDGTTYTPGKTFTKTWRIMNTGTATWSTDYKLVFVEGDQMGASGTEYRMPIPVDPGKIIDLSVSFKAPDAVGTYQGYWAIKNPSGKTFGFGSNSKFWVKIVVSAATPTVTATIPAATATTVAPTVAPTAAPEVTQQTTQETPK
ncbi:NBR1-Ig-like domain-containing protein [Leptolinea tardivitalis]|uniref:Nbr1 FW domain-containing protein n=1 Tax=Leptolinea tardivitalis TaxID=229920 RepID=A0A0P6X1Z3_9CHLR|nr:NBR1-Ig-like domain-containing protein [Leptolinea tardivitalis]KPL73467.1 hypothetical protein ADM99_04560 [Leptolinea tardivitalis]GAP21632.1 hypothetical protein LTAR_01844 [Leptolinea tardivitalis]